MDNKGKKIKKKIYSKKIKTDIYDRFATWQVNIVDSDTWEVIDIDDVCETDNAYYWIHDKFYKSMLDVWKIEYLISFWLTANDFLLVLRLVDWMDYYNIVDFDVLNLDRKQKSKIKTKLEKAWIIKSIWKDIYMNPIYFRRQKGYNEELKDLFWL